MRMRRRRRREEVGHFHGGLSRLGRSIERSLGGQSVSSTYSPTSFPLGDGVDCVGWITPRSKHLAHPPQTARRRVCRLSGPPPAIPYIFKFGEGALHLCGPNNSKLQRPTSFEGDGLCIMHRAMPLVPAVVAQPRQDCALTQVPLGSDLPFLSLLFLFQGDRLAQARHKQGTAFLEHGVWICRWTPRVHWTCTGDTMRLDVERNHV